MSSRLQLNVCNLSLGRRHLVNAYEVKAGIGVNADKTVWSMPERLECEVLQKERYRNTLNFTFTRHSGNCIIIFTITSANKAEVVWSFFLCVILCAGLLKK